MSNIFGKNFRIMTFGESHGPALGVVIEGLPSGLVLNVKDIQKDLDRRRPGQSIYHTQRREPDQVEILSGLSGGQTSGAPLALEVRNRDARPQDYTANQDRFRPGHADWPYFVKYGLPPQPGGGRSSGRETVARVAAGAVARKLLSPTGILVQAATVAVGRVRAEERDFEFAEKDPLRFADPHLAGEARREIETVISQGDSLGSVVEVSITGVPAGWGEPLFDKLDARLGGAFFSIGAVKGVEFGQGLVLARQRGSEANDPIGPEGPLTNRHGGIMGGLSTGLPIVVRLFIKPTPSISLIQNTVDLDGRPTTITVSGRHDPCLAPRLAPVAEAMALLSLADFYLSPTYPRGAK